jgi:hypothetical protein
MTFDEWYASLGGGYDNYEDIFRECWEAAQKAKEAA